MPRTLAQNAQYIANTIKPAIKSAIEAQGVTVPSTDSFLDYADRIAEIEGGGSGYQLKDLPTGAISTVSDAEPLPLNALTVSVEAWQEGSGDPSPSNIRPIHGWSSADINVVGKNWMQNLMTADIDLNGVLWHKNADSSITVSGTATGNSYITGVLKAYINDLSKTYILSGLKNGVVNIMWEYVYLYNANNEILHASTKNTQNDVIIDYLQDYPTTAYISVVCKRITNVECSGTIKPQLELGNQATTYEPYNGNIYTHAFTDQGNPLTVYGAEWNVVDGELKQTDGYIASYNGESLPSTWISDRDVYASGTTPTTGAEVVYKLTTPTTINQQAENIRLLDGVNNLYADCGEVLDGEYFVDEGALDTRKVDYSVTTNNYPMLTDGRCFKPKYDNNTNFVITPRDASGNWLDVDWTKDFEIQVAFKMTDLSSQLSIFTNGVSNTNNEYSPTIFYTSNNLRVLLSGGSGNWDLIYDTGFNPTVNTWYAIKMTYVASTQALTVDISSDLSTWTNLLTQTLNFTLDYNGASIIFGGRGADSQYWSPGNLLIDTFNTYIKGDGVNWGAFTGVFPS